MEKQRSRDAQVFLNCETAKENLRQNVYSPHGERFFYRKIQFLGYSYHSVGKQEISSEQWLCATLNAKSPASSLKVWALESEKVYTRKCVSRQSGF